MTTIRKHAEKRRNVRFAVTGMPNVKLYLTNGEELPFFIVDVSSEGTGIILANKLDIGDPIYLEFLDPPVTRVELEVRWAMLCDNLDERDGETEQLYRCGLLVKAPGIDLLKLVQSSDSVLVEALI